MRFQLTSLTCVSGVQGVYLSYRTAADLRPTSAGLRGGIPWLCAERGSSGNGCPRVSEAPTNAPASPEDSGRQNLTVWGPPWQISRDLDHLQSADSS